MFSLLAAGATAKLTAHGAAGRPWHASELAVILIGAMWAGIGVWTLLAILRPAALRPFYLAITAVSLPIGVVVSFVILAVLYFGVFTPIALVFRLVGRDVLHRRFDASAKTYWTPRRAVQDVRRYFRQF